MSKSIKQLRQQLETLQQTVINVAQELEESYGQYLAKLGDSVGKQLVLAVYQICTQKYPDNFLKLTLNHRHSLQQDIRNFKSLFNQKLSAKVLKINYYNQEIIKKLSNIILKNEQELANKNLANDQLLPHNSPTKNNNDDQFLDTENQLTPDKLIQFQLHIDQAIDEALENISQIINRYLQKESILPNQLPPKILDMALQAEESSAITSTSPNLLSLLIERQQDSEAEERDITPITAICMRLPEIEFGDPNLTVNRNQIRNILVKLTKTREQYRKTQRQYAIAQAEAAWRSSWSED